MQQLTADQTIECTLSPDVWTLTGRGNVLAIIEPAWDDHHWLLFLRDAAGDLSFSGAYRRIATLKACLRLRARRLLPVRGARARRKGCQS